MGDDEFFGQEVCFFHGVNDGADGKTVVAVAFDAGAVG